MRKPYRCAFRVTNGEETAISYDLIRAENEPDARAKFYELQELRLKFWEAHGPRENFWDFRSNGWFEILAVERASPSNDHGTSGRGTSEHHPALKGSSPQVARH